MTWSSVSGDSFLSFSLIMVTLGALTSMKMKSMIGSKGSEKIVQMES